MTHFPTVTLFCSNFSCNFGLIYDIGANGGPQFSCKYWHVNQEFLSHIYAIEMFLETVCLIAQLESSVILQWYNQSIQR